MAQEFNIFTSVKNGKVKDTDSIRQAIQYFEGKDIDIIVRKHKRKRTNPQNNWLWGVAYILIQEYIYAMTGEHYSLDDIHEHYKSKGYFGYKKSIITGELIPQGSSECCTIDFMEAKTKIQQEWALKGLDIPDPNEIDFREIAKK
jgi:hypothetical protein